MSRPTVLLFDVDGTLITTGGAGRRALERAFAAWDGVGPEVLSFPLGGMTDRAIVRQAVANLGRAPTEAIIDDVLCVYLDVLQAEVDASPAASYRVHDGMPAALDACEGRANLAIGLGTGNLERGARIKLARVGLDRRFAFGGFGCDAEDRGALLAAGARRGAERLGVPVDACRVVIIGDTWRDIAAAKAIGAESLAVATGFEPIESLRAREPTCAFASLAAPGAVRALLGDPPA